MAIDKGCNVCIITIFYIIFFIYLLFFNARYDDIKNDSQKKPSIEVRDKFIKEELINKANDTFKCNELLEYFKEKEIDETYNFEFGNIFKCSKALFIISIIQIILIFICIIASCEMLCLGVGSEEIFFEMSQRIYIRYFILNISQFIFLGILIANVVFEIQLFKSYSKGKFEDFKYFRNCNYFDIEKFNKLYGFVFDIQKNCKIVLISNLVFIGLNLFTLIFELIFCITNPDCGCRCVIE